MNILICNILVHLEGHNLGYTQNLIRYLENHPDDVNDYIFLLNPEAAEFPSLKSTFPNIKIIFFTNDEFRVFNEEKNIIKSALPIWKQIGIYAESHAAKQVILMNLDIFQHTIGLNRKYKFKISGILFAPYTRILTENSSLIATFLFQLKKLRKYLTAWLMLRNNNIKNVFILNDTASVTALNKRFSTKAFKYLPDPIYDYPNDDAVLSIREKHGISKDSIIFLCFGMIDEKKNVAKIIEAAKELSEEEASKLCILVVGKVREGYEKALQEAISVAFQQRPQLQIKQVNNFVTDPEMESYIKQSDWLSLAYVNFYSSSGVVGLAARHNKPILATKFGVIGQQTNDYGLGIAIDARNKIEITAGLSLLINDTQNYPISAARFVQEHNPEEFAKQLLGL